MLTATAPTGTGAARQTSARRFMWLQMAAVVGLLTVLYIDILPDLAAEWWTQPEASHGLLIPPIALYIAYMRREQTLRIPAEPDVRGLWLLAFGCLVFLLGSLASEFFLARISFVFMMAGLTWTFWGFRRLWTLIFPFVLLLTMVPLPAIVYNTIAAPLQLFASTVATDLAQALGVSIYRDGNIIHLANISLGVAEACSGLHSLSAMVIASLLLGYIYEAGYPGRILLLLFSVPLAIAINVLRVTGTALLADYQTEFALGFYHSFSSWLVFLMGFGLLWLSSRLFFQGIRRVA